MASSFPKLPGYVPTHDCTLTTHHKISHNQLDKNVNAHNKPIPLYPVPDPPAKDFAPEKTDASFSTSQRFFKNPNGGTDIQEQFEPTFVKLDKVVLKFDAFFKESVMESNLENWRVRQLVIFYYVEDSTLMITEPKVTNSGAPQGVFLKRQSVIKPCTSDVLVPMDFDVGDTIDIYNRQIKIIDADKYTREFFTSAMGITLGEKLDLPEDNFKRSLAPKP
jgi:hypothetical protein